MQRRPALALAGLALLALLALRPPPPPRQPSGGATQSAPPPPTTTLLLAHVDTFTHPDTSLLGSGGDATAHYRIVRGRYRMAVDAPHTLAWSLLHGNYDNGAVEVQTSMPGGAAPVAAGILFRYQDPQTCYMFQVASNGYYRLERLQQGRRTVLIDWTPSDVIDTSHHSDAVLHNTLRVEMRGDTLVLLINSVVVDTTIDSALRYGKIAVSVNSFDRQGVAVFFDNLALYRLGEE